MLVPKEPYEDVETTIVEFRPGVGGGESMIFAEEVMSSFELYSEKQGWRVTTVNKNKDTSIGKGIKLGILKVQGE
jgi:protein subunit release factor A